MSCVICTDVFNKTSNKLIKCYCHFECCKTCAKKYILSKNKKAHCMNCKVEWNREFMYTHFDTSFIKNEYKNFRENILYEKELNMMPETQAFIEHEIEKEYKINQIYSQIKNLQNEMKTLHTTLNNIRYDTFKIQENNFIRKCPNNTCNGFLSINFICSLCNTQVCEKCREIKSNDHGLSRSEGSLEQHICDENILKTIHLLKNDCKECPTCRANIFKIDGCNQMFCTSCHTAFDWNTFEIEKGQIHNPHYFEWLKQNDSIIHRIQNNIQDTKELHNDFIIYFIKNLRNVGISVYDISFFIDEIQKLMHIKQVELQKYRIDLINNNKDLRIRFLKNEITKDDFKKSIHKREKKDEKNKEIYNILNMYISCFTDIIYNMHETSKKSNIDINNFKYEIQYLKYYSNHHLKKISHIYNCKEYVIV